MNTVPNTVQPITNSRQHSLANHKQSPTQSSQSQTQSPTQSSQSWTQSPAQTSQSWTQSPAQTSQSQHILQQSSQAWTQSPAQSSQSQHIFTVQPTPAHSLLPAELTLSLSHHSYRRPSTTLLTTLARVPRPRPLPCSSQCLSASSSLIRCVAPPLSFRTRPLAVMTRPHPQALQWPVTVTQKYTTPRFAELTRRRSGTTRWQESRARPSLKPCPFLPISSWDCSVGLHREVDSRSVPLPSLANVGGGAPAVSVAVYVLWYYDTNACCVSDSVLSLSDMTLLWLAQCCDLFALLRMQWRIMNRRRSRRRPWGRSSSHRRPSRKTPRWTHQFARMLHDLGGDMAQVRSHPGRVEVSLSKTPNPQLLLMSWLVPCMAAQSPLVCDCVGEWVNERHRLYSALDKGAI